MEKYRVFADGGTGVNPFVPPWSNYKASLAVNFLKGLFMTPIAMLRVCIFMLAVLWLVAGQTICKFIPIGVLRRPIQKLYTFTGCAAALFGLGVVPLGDSLADYRRLKLPPSKKASSSVPFDAGRGCLVFVNQQGLTDILYLGMKLCPTFVFAASNGAPVQFSLVGALMRASARRIGAPPSKESAQSLAEIAANAKANWQGPVVVFAEGARTNGSGVLTWRPETFAGMESVAKPVGSAVYAMQYSKTGAYTPHHVVGTAFRHVMWLCMQPFHTVTGVWLPSDEVAAAVAGKPLQEQSGLLRTLLVRMLQGAVEVDVGAAKHVEFMGFWDASQKKGYTQKTQEQKRK